ncbi:hypothetical protein DID88_000789 [Monilinia fructigena]|uniref:Enhancer of polycomb-like N-terminal domain-containing protein n=1 Tax=Monilinia fructigena TaxID=38457 RepID=A0A395IIW6_9HELO|nr:hypothetical protein DID88_000789 [Monilinia fructigena]
MRTQPAGRVVRQKKLNRSTHQQILREDQIESAEYDSLQGQYKVETGVEKAEENEYHLQAALAANHSSSDKDAPKRFRLLLQRKTVEECTGCQYNMSTEDDNFLKDYNKKRALSNQQLSEDGFEKLMELFEETADTHTPYAAVDNTLSSSPVVKLKSLKVKLGIKSDPDDELLINQKPQKRKALDFQNVHGLCLQFVFRLVMMLAELKWI